MEFEDYRQKFLDEMQGVAPTKCAIAMNVAVKGMDWRKHSIDELAGAYADAQTGKRIGLSESRTEAMRKLNFASLKTILEAKKQGALDWEKRYQPLTEN